MTAAESRPSDEELHVKHNSWVAKRAGAHMRSSVQEGFALGLQQCTCAAQLAVS